ncbi:glycosyltransferase family 4 protein [Clostridium tetanomorphum]|uniref:Glycosyltransferase n=1 Tax=Clostridium tetanomorphum TaxID=1553 RepID=A0A923J0S6_CLOTT|nr:glycosyltransferase [Clostridium tetanomorphum]MBC2397030.1 glycosyltransferase [Clostridium tetanomorphum]NRZ99128.1 glycosyltransferase involved in cell wall biosynthesis [Clostridium tetanomorphum]
MKVLFCIRNDYLKNFAGDSMQLLKTAEYLRNMKVNIDINNGNITNYSNYDLIHLFNLTRMGETYKYYKIAKFYNKPIVISPIYWNLNKYYNYIHDSKSIRLWKKCDPYRKEILNSCNMMYPNSIIEGELIKKDFKVPLPYTVIYNGIEIPKSKSFSSNIDSENKLENHVLCVGRICPRKNQLALAEICNKLKVKLLLAGSINDKDYFNKCIAFNNVHYLGFINNHHIYNIYKSAKVHALPSYVETPGLSSLEAAINGCNIVSTIEGSAKEYFKDMAIYCNPYDYDSIFKSIEIALKSDNNVNLSHYIAKNLNWNKCVSPLYDSYCNLI